jgi:D-amino peptidase
VKIYMLVDMEGICGIRHFSQVQSDSPEFEEGRRLMMKEINVAVDAAFDAGATEIVACDTHGGGSIQVRLSEMNPRATYERPNAGQMMPALDESFAGVMLLGHHARAGTRNGFLDHTMSSLTVHRVTVNGVEVGEIGIEAAYAGHYGVPVILVEGDQATADEARELLDPDLPCAIVKWGVGRNIARTPSLAASHDILRGEIAKAIAAAGDRKPYCPDVPATVEITYCRSDHADNKMRQGVERVDARTVRCIVDRLDQLWF